MASTWLITIGGVNVTDTAQYAHRSVSKGSLSVSQSLGERRTGVITVNSADGTFSIEPGAGVSVTRKGAKLYGGSVWSKDPIIQAGTALVRHDLTLVDHNYIADRRVAGERTWRDATAGQIVTDIVNYDLDGEGVTSTFVSCSVLIKGEYKLVGFPKVSEVLSDVAQRAEAQWFIDENKNLRFFDAAATGYTAPFEVTRDNVVSLKISKSLEEYANKVKLKLAQYLMPEATERFDSAHSSYPPDGIRQDFAVPFPIASAPVVKLNNVRVDVGQVGVEADAVKPWFWSPGSQFISQLSADTPIPDTSILEVTFVGIGQLTVDATNDAEVAARGAIEDGTGFHIRVVSVEDQKSLQQADELAASILAAVDELPVTVNYRTNSALEPSCDLLKPGDQQTILGVNYIVRSIKIQDDPSSADPDLLWLEAEAVRGPMLQDFSGILKDLASGGNAIPAGAPVDDTAATPQTATEGDNLIPNGSFEAGVWDSNTEITVRVSRSVSGSQHGAAHLVVAFGPDTGGVYSESIAISEGMSLVFEGWLKRTSLTTAGLTVETRWYDLAGSELSGALEHVVTSGTDADWENFAISGTTPAGAVTARVYAYAGTHTAGSIAVDGLSLHKYSALPAAAPVNAVTAGLFYSADGSTWGMNSTWTWPGDATTIKGIERRAYFYSDEDGTVEIGYSDLATLSLDTVTNTAQDGGDWPGYETATYVRSAVRTANGDLEKGDWVKSDPVLVDASAVAGTGAVDLTMLASPTITTVGDQFHIEGQFLPGYISAGVSRTVGAAFWWEPGVDGMPEKVGESPYDTTKAPQPSPDNQGSYDIWITKASILTIAADLSGNRTGYLHGLAIEPNAFIPFKPHPNQASSAELALTFTAAQLDDAVPLPDPVAPTNLSLTIDNATYPNLFVARPSWSVGSGDLSGTDLYHIQWIFTNGPSPAPGSGSTWIRDSYVYGSGSTSYTSAPWPKDMDAPLYAWFRIRAEQGANASAWVYLSSGSVVDADSQTARPAQPASGDFSLSIIGYSKDSADAASQVMMRFTIPPEHPQTADHTELRMWSGGIPNPVDLARFEAIVKGSGTYDFWWPRVEAGETVYYTAVNCPSPNYRVSPSADNTWKTLAIPAVGRPGAVTGFSVTAGTPYKSGGVLYIDITYAFTPPAGTDFMELWIDREMYSDATFTTRVGGAFGTVQPMVLTKGFTQYRVACSNYTEYWRYNAIPVDWLRRPNNAVAVYYNATFPKTNGLDPGGIDPGGLGPGIYIDDAGKIASASHNDLLDGNFDGGGTGWNLYGGATVATGYGEDGTKGARAAVGQAVDQYLVCSPNTYYRFSWRARRNCSVAPIGYIDWFTSGGSIISTSAAVTIPVVNDPNPPYSPIYASYSIVARSPANATRAHVVGAFLYGGGTGYCDVDSATWDGIPNPGDGQAYDSNGNLISTAGATLKNGDFSIADAAGGPKDWFYGGCLLDSSIFDSPPSSAKITATSGTTYCHQNIQAIAGDVHQGRFRCYTASGGVFTVRLRYMNSAGNEVGTPVTTTVPASGGWQTITVTAPAAAGAGTNYVQLGCYTVNNAGAVIYLDGAGLNKITSLSGPLSYDGTGAAKLAFNPDLMLVEVVDGVATLKPQALALFAAAVAPNLYELVNSKYSIKADAVFANIVAATVALITQTLQVGGGSAYIVLSSDGTLSIHSSAGSLTFSGGAAAFSGNVSCASFVAGSIACLGGSLPTITLQGSSGVITCSQLSANTVYGVTWANVSGKPSTFPPSAHSHAQSDITDLSTRLSAIEGRLDALEGA